MPTYSYYCRTCRSQTESPTPTATIPCCDHNMIRNYRFAIGSSFQDHYNNSLSMYVPNRKIMNDAFKVASEQATIDTGIEHKFVARDGEDHEAFGLSSADVAEAREYHERVRVDGSPVKGNSPFKKAHLGPPR